METKIEKLPENVVKVDIEIPASKTSTFEIGTLLLEVEITYGDGIVKTQQYEVEVREDGIYERN